MITVGYRYLSSKYYDQKAPVPDHFLVRSQFDIAPWAQSFPCGPHKPPARSGPQLASPQKKKHAPWSYAFVTHCKISHGSGSWEPRFEIQILSFEQASTERGHRCTHGGSAEATTEEALQSFLHIYGSGTCCAAGKGSTPNLPTKITPTKICWL